MSFILNGINFSCESEIVGSKLLDGYVISGIVQSSLYGELGFESPTPFNSI